MPAKKSLDFENQIRRGLSEGLTDPEIAKKMGVSRNSVTIYRQRHIGPNPNYRKRITKHKHLREPVFKYFVKHNWSETKSHFRLTDSELKSIFTVGYKIPSLKKYRKDKRRKDKWTESQIKSMLQHIGIRPRSLIAQKINRGNSRAVKEKLQNIGITAPKYLNGLTLSRFREIFSADPEFYLETDAGPGRGKYTATHFKIVPWVYIKDAINAGSLGVVPTVIRKWIDSMADFQEWIHDGNAYGNLLDIVSEVKN